jgi:hypothetical protein
LSTQDRWPATRASPTVSSRAIARSPEPDEDPKGDVAMTAQTQYLETDLLGAFPGILLILVLLLTLLGVVAHVAFA